MKKFKSLVGFILVFTMLILSNNGVAYAYDTYITQCEAKIDDDLNVAMDATTEDEKIHGGFGTTLNVSDIGTVCFIKNEFYSIYADELFEEAYNKYLNAYEEACKAYDENIYTNLYSDSKGVKKVNLDYVEEVQNGSGVWYTLVTFNYTEDFSAEKNLELAGELLENIEVLYTGNTTPCAVVGIKGGTDEILTVIENENVAVISPAFEPIEGLWGFVFSAAIYSKDFNPDAGDARKILRYAAGLEELPEHREEAKEFLLLSDSDFDGKITPADARIALRIAAVIEPVRHYGAQSWDVIAW